MNFRLGFVVEQTLGHKTHSDNLRSALADDPEITPTYMPVEFHNPGGKVPVLGRNYSFRSSLYARSIATRAARSDRIEAFFFHTQVTSLFSNRLMRSIPTIISLDATPLNFDTVGSGYNHTSNPGSLGERLKFAINRRAFHVARNLVTWNRWARDSLVGDYGVPAERIKVIDPGVDLDLWTDVGIGREPSRPKPNILFVGGDFERKGGLLLMDVFRRHFRDSAQLQIVTKSPVAEEPGVSVYRDLESNSETLRRLFHEADLFVLPSLSDVSPLVAREAMVARLPLVANRVGAVAELVIEGETGFLTTPNDAEMLRDRIGRLIADASLRSSMGTQGRALALEHFDARKNARAILELLKSMARRPEPIPSGT
jgi:glycosyltransferase involved in cell wall biosynthesis